MKDQVNWVGLAMEFDASEFRDTPDNDWLKTESNMIDISGTTEEFKEMLGEVSVCCSQKLISYLKYARDVGARLIIFR